MLLFLFARHSPLAPGQVPDQRHGGRRGGRSGLGQVGDGAYVRAEQPEVRVVGKEQ